MPKKRDENVFLRGSVWWIRYTFQGEQLRESSGSEFKQDALRLLAEREGAIATGRFRGLSRITVGDLLEDIEKDYRLNALASQPQLLSRLKRLKPAFGAIRAAEFSSQHIERYRLKRIENGAERATVNREMQILSRAWNLAFQREKVTRQLYFPLFREDNVRTGFLSEEQYQALLRALPWYLKPLLVNAYHVPCRFGELTNLFLTQLDFEHNEIVLNPGETKNRDGRHMPMIGPMRETLLMQRAIRDEKFPECPYVFFSEKGERIVDIRRAWKTACKAAGLGENTLFHDLRRSAARNMRRAGIAEHTIMKIAGWKTRSMFQRYDIQDSLDLKRAAEAMDRWIESTRPQTPAKNLADTGAPAKVSTDLRRSN
jgi:integrase